MESDTPGVTQSDAPWPVRRPGARRTSGALHSSPRARPGASGSLARYRARPDHCVRASDAISTVSYGGATRPLCAPPRARRIDSPREWPERSRRRWFPCALAGRQVGGCGWGSGPAVTRRMAFSIALGRESIAPGTFKSRPGRELNFPRAGGSTANVPREPKALKWASTAYSAGLPGLDASPDRPQKPAYGFYHLAPELAPD